MRPSLVLEHNREKIRTILAQHRASNVRVFGSALRGEDTEASDLDLLVDVESDVSLLDLVKAQYEIEDALGVRVDLLTPEDLPESWRSRILSEAVSI